MNTQTQENNAPAPELLEQMPADARNPKGPVTKSYRELGERRAETIVAADQAIDKAKEGAENTRLEGCKDLLNLSHLERSTYIIGVESKLGELDGGTRTKSHNNYVTALRRIDKHIGQADSPEVIGESMKILEGKGTFAEKMAQFKTQSGAGGNRMAGSNATALGNAVKDAAIAALKAEGIENPTGDLIAAKVQSMVVAQPGDSVETTEETVEGETQPPIEQPKGDLKAEGQVNRRASAATNGRDAARAVEFVHADGIEECAYALGKRMMQATGTPFVEIGRHLIEELDAAFHKAEATVNGVVVPQGEAQEMAQHAQ